MGAEVQKIIGRPRENPKIEGKGSYSSEDTCGKKFMVSFIKNVIPQRKVDHAEDKQRTRKKGRRGRKRESESAIRSQHTKEIYISHHSSQEEVTGLGSTQAKSVGCAEGGESVDGC